MLAKLLYGALYVVFLWGMSYLIAFPISVVCGIYSDMGINIITIIVMLAIHSLKSK